MSTSRKLPDFKNRTISSCEECPFGGNLDKFSEDYCAYIDWHNDELNNRIHCGNVLHNLGELPWGEHEGHEGPTPYFDPRCPLELAN